MDGTAKGGADGVESAAAMASRRQILTLLGALGLPLSTMTDLLAASNDKSAAKPVRVRTITAGLELSPRGESQRIESTLDFLAAAKRAFVNAGYEVQTLRIATNPWLAERVAARSPAIARAPA